MPLSLVPSDGYDKHKVPVVNRFIALRARCTLKQELTVHCDKLFDMERPDAIGIQKDTGTQKLIAEEFCLFKGQF